MISKLKIKNQIIVFFTILYVVYLSITLIYTYNSNKTILIESLKNRMTETFYQLSYTIEEDIRIDNIYEINQKVLNLSNKSTDVAYIVVYDDEEKVLGSNIKKIPKKLNTVDYYLLL